jgi:hypothetical protein
MKSYHLLTITIKKFPLSSDTISFFVEIIQKKKQIKIIKRLECNYLTLLFLKYYFPLRDNIVFQKYISSI